MAPTKTKTKKKKKIGCLPLSSCFQALHSSSSLNPNAKLAGDGVIARGVWEGWVGRTKEVNPNAQLASDGVIARGVWEAWVGRTREVDGLIGGRVVGRLEA
jgi:hypothetical protein